MIGARLHLKLGKGARLSEDEIRRMWELRESLTPVKPGRDVEEAWSEFRDTVESSAAVGRLVKADGRVVAMLSSQIVDLEFEGAPLRLLLARNGFVAREERSHPLTMLMYAAVIARCCTLRPGLRHYFCFISAPVAAVRFGEMNRVILPGLPDLSPLERLVLDETLRRNLHHPEDLDEERQAFDVGTVPEPLSERWLVKHRDHPLWLHYQRQLPNWREGYGLPMAARIQPSRMYRALKPMARRSWHRLLGRSNLHS